MTDKTEHDVDGLLRKNAELLGQLKQLKARVTEIEAERDAAQSSAQAATDTMQRVQLLEPVEHALAGAFVAPWRVMKPLLDEHFDFALGDNGKPQIKMKATGDIVAVDGMIAAMAPIPDLAAAMRPPSGGGARGTAGSLADKEAPKTKAAAVAGPFGLR